jgi:outer membrane lipoprotein SlyB
MKPSILGTLALSLLLAGSVQADEVLSATHDNTAGKSVGAMTGMMIGAVGGPLGALLGAGVGWLVGQGVQEGAGLSENAYTVRGADGETHVVRSPNHQFAIGEQVDRQGGRLHARTDSGQPLVSRSCAAPAGSADSHC